MDMFEQLLTVQNLDAEIRSAEQELRDIPAHQKVHEERLAVFRQAIQELQEKLKKNQAAIKEQELEGQSKRDKIAKLRQQQMELKSNRDFKAMQAEIDAVAREITQIEDQELALMEQAERLRVELAEKQQQLAAEEKAVEHDKKELNRRAAEIQSRLTQVREERKRMASGIKETWLSRYELICSRKFPALVRIQDGVCGGCHMQLPPAVVHEARRRTSIVSCLHCGRLLYY
ncbi:MAG: zinc ribbon domain-containing protein [Kiritimatiellia bacterium]